MDPNLVITAAAILCLAIAIKKKRKRLRRKRVWVKSWIKRREQFGAYHALLRELAAEDQLKYKNFLRMDEASFDDLLQKVSPIIQRQDTLMRKSISPGERLALTLRFLATGNTYQDLEYLYRVPHNTLSALIPETCKVIYEVLKDEYLKVPQSEEDWLEIAEGFKQRWNFPNCIGAIDGKHVLITPPPGSGSVYYNYKNTFSIVQLALVDADYKFIYVDVGVNGRVSDGGVFRDSSLKKALDEQILNIPSAACLPGREKAVPFVIVADEAFPLKENIMKPYSSRGLDPQKRIFNYRLSRARRIVENAFGIQTNRFRVFHQPFRVHPDKVQWMVLCTCVLHNYLRTKSTSRNVYTPSSSLDRENTTTGEVRDGSWRRGPIPNGIAPLAQQGSNRSGNAAKDVQAELCDYFNTNGQVPWQWRVLE